VERLYEVYDIASSERGAIDERVLEVARRRNAMLVTADKDFGELVFRRKRLSTGVLLIRLSGMDPQEKGRLVSTFLQKHEEELAEKFVVLTKTAARIRSTLT
jgi:predicted nuclease of predicted toxin-antitoxin system